MPDVIVAPASAANSFVSVSEVETYLLDYEGQTPGWLPVESERAVISASRKLSGFSWKGTQNTLYADNPLPFPNRENVTDANGAILPSAETPFFLIAATSLMALELYNQTQGTGTVETSSEVVKQAKLGSLSVTFDTSTDSTVTRADQDAAFQLGVTLAVYELIMPYIDGASSSGVPQGIRLWR